MKRNIYRFFILSLVASVGLSSCLNDENIENQEYGLINLNSKKIIEIPATVSHEVGLALKPEGFQDITIGEVRLAAENPAAEDIVVSLTSSQSADILAGETIFPLDQVVVPATVTIPKGERSVPLVVSINTNMCTDDPQYVAVSITSVDKTGYIISGNFGYIALNMKAKSAYDGDYVCNGYRIRPGNPTEPVVDEIRHLSTINSRTVQDPKFGNYAAYHVNVEVTTDLITVGGVVCYKVNAVPVNDSGDVVGGMYTIFTGDPTTAPAAPTNPTEINYYNPVTKTFVLNCYYTSTINRIMYEVLVMQE